MHKTELMLKCVVIARYSVNILYILLCLILVLQTLLSFYIGLFSWYFGGPSSFHICPNKRQLFPPTMFSIKKVLLKSNAAIAASDKEARATCLNQSHFSIPLSFFSPLLQWILHHWATWEAHQQEQQSLFLCLIVCTSYFSVPLLSLPTPLSFW